MAAASLATFDDLSVFSVWVTALLGSAIAIVVVVWLIFGITKSVLVIDADLDTVIGVGKRILDNTSPLSELATTVKLCEAAGAVVGGIETDAGAILRAAGKTPASAWTGR